MGVFTTIPTAQAVPDIAAASRHKPGDPTALGIAAQQIVQLNFRYLSLAATCPEFSGAVAAQLTDTDPDQRWRMADCRFSLFSLALSDSRRWLPLLNGSFVYSPLSAESEGKAIRKEFSVAAVFLAWHFAQSQPLAAKVLLCISDDIATALQRIPAAHLPSLANSASEWLVPRWPRHPIFWSALLRYSRDPSESRLTAIKSLGRQLLAAESLELRKLPKVVGRRHLSSNGSIERSANGSARSSAHHRSASRHKGPLAERMR